MHLAVSIAIAIISIAVLNNSLSRMAAHLRAPGQGPVLLATIALVWGGFAGDSIAASGRPETKLAVLFAFSALILLAPRGTPHDPGGPTLGPVVAIVLLWVWLFLVNTVANADVSSTTHYGRLASGLPWVALLLSWHRAPVTREILSAVASGALALVGIAAPILGESAWRGCDQFKCGIFGGSFVGPFSSENYIGQQAILVGALSLVTMGWRDSRRIQLLVAVLLAATESRTAQVALVTALVAALLVGFHRLIARRTSSGPLSSMLVAVAAPSIYVAAAYTFFVRSEPGNFSNRGHIWVRARSVLEERMLTGLGIDRWDELQAVGVLPAHYPHSVYVLLAFSGGVIGVVLFAIWVAACIRTTAQRQDGPFAAVVFTVVFLTVGLLEVTWNPLTIDGLTWHALAMLSIAVSGRIRSDEVQLANPRLTPQGRVE